jgi:hypothetical protein
MRKALIAVFLGIILMFTSATLPALASDNGVDHKVTICHRTNSEKNPYVEITVDKASVVGGHVEVADGHDGHDGPIFAPGMKAAGTKWGDIIPEFDYVAEGKKNNPDVTGHYGGQNYTNAGKAILAAGCEVETPDEPKPTVTVTVEVPGPTHTVEVPGPTQTVEVPGPTVTVPGETQTVNVPGPTVTVTAPAVPGPTVTEKVNVPGPTVTAPGTEKTVTVPGPTKTVTETITKVVNKDGKVIREDTTRRGGTLPHTGAGLMVFWIGLALLIGGLVIAAASGLRLTRVH